MFDDIILSKVSISCMILLLLCHMFDFKSPFVCQRTAFGLLSDVIC